MELFSLTSILLVTRRVTLVVAFSFLLKNFGRWQVPTNVTLLFLVSRDKGRNGMVFRYTWVYSKDDTMAHTRRLVVIS